MKSFATTCSFAIALLFAAAPAFALQQTASGAVIAGGLPFPPTFEAIQANVFTPSCALSFCHGAAMSANMDLRAGAAYASIVGVPSVEVPSLHRIEPFAPDNSYLICKLEACPQIVGQQMPLIGGPLDPAVINVLRVWVLSGAPEFGSVAVEPTSWGQVKAGYR